MSQGNYISVIKSPLGGKDNEGQVKLLGQDRQHTGRKHTRAEGEVLQNKAGVCEFMNQLKEHGWISHLICFTILLNILLSYTSDDNHDQFYFLTRRG